MTIWMCVSSYWTVGPNSLFIHNLIMMLIFLLPPLMLRCWCVCVCVRYLQKWNWLSPHVCVSLSLFPVLVRAFDIKIKYARACVSAGKICVLYDKRGGNTRIHIPLPLTPSKFVYDFKRMWSFDPITLPLENAVLAS